MSATFSIDAGSTWRWVKSHKAVVIGGAFLATLGAWNDARDLFFLIVTHFGSILRAPDGLWLRWVLILVGIGSIVWGAWRSDRRDERAAALRRAEVDALAQEMRGVLAEVAAVPQVLTTYGIVRERWDHQRDIRDKISRVMERYRGELERLSSRPSQDPSHPYPNLDRFGLEVRQLVAELSLVSDEAVVLLDLELPEFQMTPLHDCGMRFDRDVNAEYLAAHRRNAQVIGKLMIAYTDRDELRKPLIREVHSLIANAQQTVRDIQNARANPVIGNLPGA